MLNSVLTKLIECMNEHNKYVLAGPPTVANHYAAKCELLIECLEDANYTPEIETERVEIVDGMYRGCCGDMYTFISFNVPDVSNIANDEINAFGSAGFEWIWEANVMIYEFETNRKGKESA